MGNKWNLTATKSAFTLSVNGDAVQRLIDELRDNGAEGRMKKLLRKLKGNVAGVTSSSVAASIIAADIHDGIPEDRRMYLKQVAQHGSGITWFDT